MPSLPIFSRRERIWAITGFLLGVLIPPVLLSGAWHLLASTQTAPGVHEFDGPALVLILGMLGLGFVSLFWSLALLSNSAATGSRLVLWCGRIWIIGIVAKVLTELIQRRWEAGTILLLILLIVFRPRNGQSARLWSPSASLEEREATPFLWGASAALGTLGLSAALSTMDFRAFGGFPGHALMGLSLLAEGFVLGMLLQTWTCQRWPGLLVAVLVLLGLGTVWFFQAKGIGLFVTGNWAAPAWPLGVFIADFAASRDRSPDSDDGEDLNLTAPA